MIGTVNPGLTTRNGFYVVYQPDGPCERADPADFTPRVRRPAVPKSSRANFIAAGANVRASCCLARRGARFAERRRTMITPAVTLMRKHVTIRDEGAFARGTRGERGVNLRR